MAQTYIQLQQQIAALQAQADELKQSELATVISQTRAAIQAYGITPQDLFGSEGLRPAKGGKRKKPLSLQAKYADGKGNIWVGRGKRPKWLGAALAAGAKLEEFEAGNAGTKEPVSEVARPQMPPVAAATAPAKKRRAAKKGMPEETAPKSAATKKAVAKKTGVKKSAARKATREAKYQDGAGNSWSGMGPKPKWVKTAIAAGRKLEDLLA